VRGGSLAQPRLSPTTLRYQQPSPLTIWAPPKTTQLPSIDVGLRISPSTRPIASVDAPLNSPRRGRPYELGKSAGKWGQIHPRGRKRAGPARLSPCHRATKRISTSHISEAHPLASALLKHDHMIKGTQCSPRVTQPASNSMTREKGRDCAWPEMVEGSTKAALDPAGCGNVSRPG